MLKVVDFCFLCRVLLQYIVILDFKVKTGIVHANHYVVNAQKIPQQYEESRWHNSLREGNQETMCFSVQEIISKMTLTILTVHADMPLSCNSSSYSVNSL